MVMVMMDVRRIPVLTTKAMMIVVIWALMITMGSAMASSEIGGKKEERVVIMVTEMPSKSSMDTSSTDENPDVDHADQCGSGRTYDRQLQVCCSTCDRGFGVALPCTGPGPGNETVCTQCSDGATYSSTLSHEESCQPCSNCPANARPLHRCNITHNTKCECLDGFWYDPEMKTCAKCLSCQPGFEVTRQCAPYQNTHCRPCPKGYFSDKQQRQEYSSSKCRLCSLCKPGQLVRTACSAARDTECVDANSLLTGIRGGTELPTVTKVNLFPVYCAIPAFILVSLILFVIFKRWRQFPCNRSPPCKNTANQLGGAQIGGGIGIRNYNKSNTNTATNSISSYNHHIDHQQGNNKESKPMLLTGDSQVHRLPKEILEELERNLATNIVDDKKIDKIADWAALAKNLGYSESKIKVFRQKVAATNQSSAAKIFLKDWIYNTSSQNATIGILVDALENIDRSDLAGLIRREVTDLTTGGKLDNNNRHKADTAAGPVHFV